MRYIFGHTVILVYETIMVSKKVFLGHRNSGIVGIENLKWYSGLAQLFVIVCTKPQQRPALTLGGISESLNRNYSCSEVMKQQIDKLWDASLTDARFKFIACLTCHKNFLSVLWCNTKKEMIRPSEECSLYAGLLCSKTQTQSAEPLCSSRFVFCEE